MQVRNETTGPILINDMPGAQAGSSLVLAPGVVTSIYDEDAERSSQLNSFLVSGVVVKVGTSEPATGSQVGGTPAADVTADLVANSAAAAAAQVTANTGISRLDSFSDAQGRLKPTVRQVLATPYLASVPVGLAGEQRKIYSSQFGKGSEYEVENLEGSETIPNGAAVGQSGAWVAAGANARSMFISGAPYTQTLKLKAARQADSDIVAAGNDLVFNATFGNGFFQGTGYRPDLDNTGATILSALQKAHDDAEDGARLYYTTPGNLRRDQSGPVPVLNCTKDLTIIGVQGVNGTLFNGGGSYNAIHGGPGAAAAIVFSNPDPDNTIFLSLANIVVVGHNGPAILLKGNVVLRANDCAFRTAGGFTGPVIAVMTGPDTAGPIHILDDCSFNRGGGGSGPIIEYQTGGAAFTGGGNDFNWLRLNRGSSRNNANGHFLRVVGGYGNAEFYHHEADIFGGGLLVKNDSGSPITVGFGHCTSYTTAVDANVTIDRGSQV